MSDARSDWERLGRHLAREETPAERAETERWLADHPAEARALGALDAATRNLVPVMPVDVEAALRRVKARRDVTARSSWPWALAAAAAVVLVAVGLPAARQRAASNMSRSFAAAPGAPGSFALGTRARVVLAPGSRVVASGDHVTFTGAGRAYFVVAHDAAHPFVVQAGNATVRDVGTRFTVERDGSSTRVVVTDGAVDVTVAGTVARATAGDVAEATAGGVSVHHGAATADDVAWTTGRLVFRDAPLSAVLRDLARWYGVHIDVRDSTLLQRHFSGEFDNQPVDRVLQTLALALGTRIDRGPDSAVLGNRPRAR